MKPSTCACLLLLTGCATRTPTPDVSGLDERPAAIVLDDGTLCRHVDDADVAAPGARQITYACDATRGILGTPRVEGDMLRLDLARLDGGTVVESDVILLPLQEIQLADGTLCTHTNDDTTTYEGMRLGWTCTDRTALLGFPIVEGGTMTIRQATMEGTQVTSTREVPIARVGDAVAG